VDALRIYPPLILLARDRRIERFVVGHGSDSAMELTGDICCEMRGGGPEQGIA
jgi:hypothetical protein